MKRIILLVFLAAAGFLLTNGIVNTSPVEIALSSFSLAIAANYVDYDSYKTTYYILSVGSGIVLLVAIGISIFDPSGFIS